MTNIVNQINTLGYAILESIITPQECEQYKVLLERDYDKYSPLYASNNLKKSKHGLDNKIHEKVVYNLHNKDILWYKLFFHEQILNILDSILVEGSYHNSEPYYLYNNSARNPLKGNTGQQLHCDSRLPGVNYCIVANVIWMLDDFTIENGATRIIPGTHKNKSFPEDGKVYTEEILITGKKGSVLIFDANLWHGGGGNFNGASRWAVALGYARWFWKPSFDYMLNTPKHIFNQLSENQKKLMGFTCTPPKDEFTRVRTISNLPETPLPYELP